MTESAGALKHFSVSKPCKLKFAPFRPIIFVKFSKSHLIELFKYSHTKYGESKQEVICLTGRAPALRVWRWRRRSWIKTNEVFFCVMDHRTAFVEKNRAPSFNASSGFCWTVAVQDRNILLLKRNIPKAFPARSIYFQICTTCFLVFPRCHGRLNSFCRLSNPETQRQDFPRQFANSNFLHETEPEKRVIPFKKRKGGGGYGYS